MIDGGYIEGNVYHYYLTDHLGNNRVVVNASGTVILQKHHYPFGTAFAENTVDEQKQQPYKYNGKELDQMHGLNLYDYSARYYECAIGRFTMVDPLAEEYYSISPYDYVGNNPLKYTDPTGMSPVIIADVYDIDPDSKKVTILRTDDPYDIVRIKGKTPITYPKGEVSEEYYNSIGYQTYTIHAAGMSITDFGLSIFAGEVLYVKALSFISTLIARNSNAILAKISGILRDAVKGKGIYSLGESTVSEAMEAGKAWTGPGASVASDGKTLISADGLRQFRPPSYKPNLGKTQANFEWRNVGQTQWQGNGHLTIIK